jgi:hypothetical protein
VAQAVMHLLVTALSGLIVMVAAAGLAALVRRLR